MIYSNKQTLLRRKWMLIAVYKIAVMAMTLMLGLLIVRVAAAGKIAKASGRKPEKVWEHRKRVYLLDGASFILVILIEAGVRLKGGSTHDAVYWIHLSCAAVYVLSLLLLNTALSGNKNGSAHAVLGTVFFCSYGGLVLLGIPMTLTRF